VKRKARVLTMGTVKLSSVRFKGGMSAYGRTGKWGYNWPSGAEVSRRVCGVR
jgi:hypothetical protein